MRRRIAATAVLAVGLALGTAGCTFLAPQATLLQYNPSDGVALNVGALQIRNAFVISPKGTDASFIGVLINTSKSTIEVELQYTAHTKGKEVPGGTVVKMSPGQVISFGNPGVTQLVFRSADAKPGALLRMFVVYGGKSGPTVSGKYVELPVLTGTQSYYNGLSPSPLPKSSGTPTPIPTSTATN